MLPGDHPHVDGTEEPSDPTKAQPRPAAATPAQASQEAAGFKKPQLDQQKPTCLRCGLTVPDHGPPHPSPGLSRLQGSSSSVHGSSRRSRRSRRSSESGSHQPTATPADSCLHLLLACLWCQCSVLVLGLLEACSSCLDASCSCCCRACARCCSAIREAPVEELNCHAHCHSVLFESCCEPAECLEFCLECCEICHRS
ncbi:myoD family inhibitor domain-containing protein-like [Cyclopterus lumpus]|uniref:myoD family inhibitor domain-containing protein-like n=1 Tax=Cyclopterus lumpus TaxID=8103 RepID=UPI00148659A5|nr:myoD family inhibitor domain-containing protein-like [Cyclopterus lumpus]